MMANLFKRMRKLKAGPAQNLRIAAKKMATFSKGPKLIIILCLTPKTKTLSRSQMTWVYLMLSLGRGLGTVVKACENSYSV
jgi:hypothetical protein